MMSNETKPAMILPLGLLLLIWHAMLGADYVIARFALSVASWPPVMPALALDATWLSVAWGMAVWLGFVAALFLMLKDDASVLLFFAAAVAQLSITVGLRAADGAVWGLPVMLFTGLAVVPPVVGWIYARALNRRGLLH